MKKLNVTFLLLVLFGMLFVVGAGTGCVNAAAERLAEDLWIDHVDIILKSNELTQMEKELYVLEIMQAVGKTDDEMATYIEKIKPENMVPVQTKESGKGDK